MINPPPTGTVTFLFTDIEGSTRLWQERPDAMRAALAEHDEALRAAIEAHGGYIFATGGDGFAAAFSRAADAVAAAEQSQARLAGLSLVTVRMGLNTGEAHERDGDYFGTPVNRTARLMAAGHGGQVLLSAVTAELVPGLVLKNLGEHCLRDLESPMQVWQLGSGEFPALRTLDQVPGNLPVQRTSFIGRRDEVKRLCKIVEAERLVTLTGPGGVGKSRLALQVAAELAPRFRDGVWFVPLASLGEEALVAATILEALGVPERQGEVAVDTLCSWASTRQTLVVIDNCEHLAGEVAAVVDRTSDSSPTINVLATSQAPLGLRGEHVWAVAPLSGSKGLSRDSVELFVDRARFVRANFELNGDNESAVVEICDRLDHVPLAIELAAARVRGMAPAAIAKRLDQRLHLLSSNDRLAPGRHRTLDAAVRWSYELCDEVQQRVFDRLSVFAGPFTIDAAESVVGGDGVEEWVVLDALLALVDKSLVIADDSSDTRYRLLETMRQFGLADLQMAGTAELHIRRHADYYATFVLSRRPQLHGRGDTAAIDEVEGELENIRVALRHSVQDRTSPRFEKLFSALHTLWYGHRTFEGASWASELQGRPVVDPASSIEALGFAASVMHNRDLDAAKRLAQASYDLWASSAGPPPLMAITMLCLITLLQGQVDVAIAGCNQVLDLADDEPDLFVRAYALASCYAVLATCGAFDRLDTLRRQITELVDQLDNRFLMAQTATALVTAVQVTDPDRAREMLERAYLLNDEIRNQRSSVVATMLIVVHELRVGDVVEAALWATRALQLAVDHAPTYIAPVISLAIAVIRRYAPADAAQLLGALRRRRLRNDESGTHLETEAEARWETTLRQRTGDEFDRRYAEGEMFSEAEMIRFTFTHLDAVRATLR
jgi:predicted ATPase